MKRIFRGTVTQLKLMKNSCLKSLHIPFTGLSVDFLLGHQMCESVSPPSSFLKHQVDVLQFNSPDTVYLEIAADPKVNDSFPKDCSQPTSDASCRSQ